MKDSYLLVKQKIVLDTYWVRKYTLLKSLMNKLNKTYQKKYGYIFKRMLESLKNTLHIPAMAFKRTLIKLTLSYIIEFFKSWWSCCQPST